jgi:seryl-tRNA(Sec) selenium transferase
MLSARPEVLRERAERLAEELSARVPGLVARIVQGHGEVGGGSLPREKLRGPVVEITHPNLAAREIERRARAADPPVIGVLKSDAFRLDPRTLTEAEVGIAASALGRALTGG